MSRELSFECLDVVLTTTTELQVPIDHGDLTGNFGYTTVSQTTSVVIATNCFLTGGSNGTGFNYGLVSGGGNVNFGPNGGSNTSSNTNQNGVITAINYADFGNSLSDDEFIAQNYLQFISQLNNEQKDIFNSHPELINYLVNNYWSSNAREFVMHMITTFESNNLTNSQKQLISSLINTCSTNGSTFEINNLIDQNNSLSFNNLEDYNEFVYNLYNETGNTFNLVDNGSDKVAKFRCVINFFTNINIEVGQKLSPWSLDYITSGISGNTLGLSYSQMTPTDGGEVSTSGNIKTIKFSGDLNLNLFVEGIGTIHTYHITFTVKVNSLTGEPISINLTGL